MKTITQYILLTIILFSLVGTGNANEFYAILFHRGITMQDALDYYNQMLPSIQQGVKICKTNDSYNVIYGSFATKAEAEEEGKNLNTQNYTWIEIDHFDPLDCVPPQTLSAQDKPDLPPRESFVFPKRKFGQNKKNLKTRPALQQQSVPQIPQTGNILAYPETVIKCELSNRFINRIIAPGDKKIKDLIVQKGAGIEVKIEGKNGFVTFLKKKDSLTGKIKFQTSPVEIYAVVEPDIIYTIIGQPKDTIAQTIELVWSKKNIEKNLKFFAGLPFEKKVVKMIKTVMNNKIPDSFNQTKIGKPINIFQNVNVYLNRLVVAEGEGLILKEYIITLKETSDKDKIPVKEQNFLLPELAKKPIGISVEEFFLTKKQPSRVFIVERKNT